MMILEKQTGLIWFNGKFVPWEEANVHVLSHTLHYGFGVFEGVRAYEANGRSIIFRLQAHMDRFFESAHIINMAIPYTKEVLIKAQKDVLKENKLKSAYIRPMAFYGGQHLGLQLKGLSTNIIVAAWEWSQYFNNEKNVGIRAHTSSFIRNNVNATLLKAKANGHYVNSILALQEANALGFDEALMLDAQGYVSEGSSSNVFIVRNGSLITPQTSSILEGITRDTVMTLARDLGIDVIEKNITRDNVYIADEMFFTGTAAEINAVSELDKRKIGDGTIGEITKALQAEYMKTVCADNQKYEHWLTSV